MLNAETGELVKELNGHSDIVVSVCFSPDGKLLASCSWDKSIVISNSETGE